MTQNSQHLNVRTLSFVKMLPSVLVTGTLTAATYLWATRPPHNPRRAFFANLPPLDFEPPARNSAFVFVTPFAADNTGVVRLVRDRLAAAGVTIDAEGEIFGKEIDAKQMIDFHQYPTASKATLLKPAQYTGVDELAFKDCFGMHFADALAEDRVFNALDAMRLMGADVMDFTRMWATLNGTGRVQKVGHGADWVGEMTVKGREIFVWNGAYMFQRSIYTAPKARVHYFCVSWPHPQAAAQAAALPDEGKDTKQAAAAAAAHDDNTLPLHLLHLPFETFSRNVVGAEDLRATAEGSIRGRIHAHWRELGLPADPSVPGGARPGGGPMSRLDTAIYASPSPFNAMSERVNWLGADKKSEPLYVALHEKLGISDALIERWRRNGTVVIDRHTPEEVRASNGSKMLVSVNSAFGAFEGLDVVETLQQARFLKEQEEVDSTSLTRKMPQQQQA